MPDTPYRGFAQSRLLVFALVRFAQNLLMDVIPKIDPDLVKTRTDILLIRAAFASS